MEKKGNKTKTHSHIWIYGTQHQFNHLNSRIYSFVRQINENQLEFISTNAKGNEEDMMNRKDSSRNKSHRIEKATN